MSRDYADGDVIFDTQWRALKNAMNGNGVLDPAPTLTPGGAMDVDIGAGDVYRNKILVPIIPGSVTFTVASAKSKWGAIWVPATGIPYMLMGAEADRPIMPEPTSWDDILLGTVLIPLGMTVIGAADIIEMMFITSLQEHIQNVSNPHVVTNAQLGAEPAFAKNSAFNKDFGTSNGEVPGISTTIGLGTLQAVQTDSTGKIRTSSSYIPKTGDIIKSERFGFAKDVLRESVTATSWAIIGNSMSIEPSLDTIHPNLPGCTKYYRFGVIMGGLGGSSISCRIKVGGTVEDTLGPTGASTYLNIGTPFTLTNATFVTFIAEAEVTAGTNYVYDWWVDVLWIVN